MHPRLVDAPIETTRELSGGCLLVASQFGGALALSVASALGDVAPGVQKLVFGLLFPIALLNIVATGSQLFTGNTASAPAARSKI